MNKQIKGSILPNMLLLCLLVFASVSAIQINQQIAQKAKSDGEPKAAGEIKPRENQDKRLYVHLVAHSNTEEGGFYTAEEWYSGQDDQNISPESKKYTRKDLTGH